MPVKSVYLIEGRRWLSLRRAAGLLATNVQRVKRLMGDGTLDWRQLRPGSSTLLVAEDMILARRLTEGTGMKEAARRAAAPTRTADQRKRSMATSPIMVRERGGGTGVFEPTWDPRAVPAAIDGRASDGT